MSLYFFVSECDEAWFLGVVEDHHGLCIGSEHLVRLRSDAGHVTRIEGWRVPVHDQVIPANLAGKVVIRELDLNLLPSRSLWRNEN